MGGVVVIEARESLRARCEEGEEAGLSRETLLFPPIWRDIHRRGGKGE
jgi:hypothetical protein